MDIVVDDLDDGLAGLAVIAALGCGGYNLGVLVLAQLVQLGSKVVKFRVPKRVIVHFLLAPHDTSLADQAKLYHFQVDDLRI